MTKFPGVTFFKSVSRGWLTYYGQSKGPTFTEEQVRIADDMAYTLDGCYPITDFLSPQTHSEICKGLNSGDLEHAAAAIENDLPPFWKIHCFEVLKAGIWMLNMSAPQSIRAATYNILGCDHFFPRV